MAQEWPDTPHLLAATKVDFGHQEFGLALGLGEEFALRTEDVARSPEVDAGRIERRLFVADAVAAQHRQTVGYRMASVAEGPGAALTILFGLVVGGVPA